MNITFLYVAIVYAVAVGLARRGGVEFPWRIAGLFYALTLVFFFKAMALDYINVPVDFVLSLPPWHNIIPHRTIINGEMNDLALQMVPWAHQARQAWRTLHVPLWNAAAGCGYPLLGNGQSAALSPLRLIALPLSLGHSFAAEGAMKVLVALSFAYLFGRGRGYSELASSITAISFGFCTFIVYWLHFPHATVAAFTPAVFHAIELLLERVTYRRGLFLIAVLVVLMFGGHPETAAHVSFFGGLYILFVLAVERRKDASRVVRTFAGAGLVATFVALPFLVPFAEGLTRSQRLQAVQANPPGITRAEFPVAVLLLQPHFYGNLEEGKWGPAITEFTTGFAGVFAVAAAVALLLRLLIRRTWHERETFFILMTPLTVAVVLGAPYVSDLFHRLPLFSLAANGRIRLMLAWFLAVQAGAAVDLVRRGESMRYLLAGVAAVTAALACLVWGTRFPTGWAHDNSIAASMPSLLTLALAALVLVRGRRGPLMPALLVFGITVELWSVGIRWNPSVSPRALYPWTPMIHRIVELTWPVGKQPPPRVVGIGPYFFPNTAAMYGLQDIRAHDPMANGRYMGLLRIVAGYQTGDYFALWTNTETTLLDYLGVRYVMSNSDQTVDPERYKTVFDSREGKIFENRDVLPRFFSVRNVILEFNQDRFVQRLRAHTSWKDTAIVHDLKVQSDQERRDLLQSRHVGSPEASVQITSSDALNPSGPDYRLHVSAPRWTLLVSSEPFWPGWRVLANGKSLRPMQVNGPFLGFVVPPGRSEVRVVYDPLEFKAAVAASLLTIALLALYPLLRSRLARDRA